MNTYIKNLKKKKFKNTFTKQKSHKNRTNAPFKTDTEFAIYKVSNKVS